MRNDIRHHGKLFKEATRPCIPSGHMSVYGSDGGGDESVEDEGKRRMNDGEERWEEERK